MPISAEQEARTEAIKAAVSAVVENYGLADVPFNDQISAIITLANYLVGEEVVSKDEVVAAFQEPEAVYAFTSEEYAALPVGSIVRKEGEGYSTYVKVKSGQWVAKEAVGTPDKGVDDAVLARTVSHRRVLNPEILGKFKPVEPDSGIWVLDAKAARSLPDGTQLSLDAMTSRTTVPPLWSEIRDDRHTRGTISNANFGDGRRILNPEVLGEFKPSERKPEVGDWVKVKAKGAFPRHVFALGSTVKVLRVDHSDNTVYAEDPSSRFSQWVCFEEFDLIAPESKV